MNVTDLPVRFAAKIALSIDGCWIFTGARQTSGYGSISHRGRTVLAHRLSYELLVGPIPDGLQIDHLCQVKACCNPAHLEPVTGWENMRRRFNTEASRQTCPQGHHYSGDNLYRNPRGSRGCRARQRTFQRASRAKRRRQSVEVTA